MQTVTDKLHDILKQQGVSIKMNAPCTSLSMTSDGKLTVHSVNDQITVDHVISCIPAQCLANIVPLDWKPLADELSNIHTTTVGVVNLEYEGSVVPVEGFGYLVPSSDETQVLGIIFDSCAFPENDRHHGGKTTRITVSVKPIFLPFLLSCAFSFFSAASMKLNCYFISNSIIAQQSRKRLCRSGFETNLNSSLSFGQTALAFYFFRPATSCLSYCYRFF